MIALGILTCFLLLGWVKGQWLVVFVGIGLTGVFALAIIIIAVACKRNDAAIPSTSKRRLMSNTSKPF
jgi:hypothetical protein